MKLTNRLYLLNTDILQKIYEYDNTYREHYNNIVKKDIWQHTWLNWISKMNNIYTTAVMKYLMNVWGVYEDSPFPYHEYFIRKYFPEGINIVGSYSIVDMGKYSCSVFYDNECIFSGWVLSRQQENEENYFGGIWGEINKICIYVDIDNDLYVYQSL